MTLAFFAPLLARPAADMIGLPLGVISLLLLLVVAVGHETRQQVVAAV